MSTEVDGSRDPGAERAPAYEFRPSVPEDLDAMVALHFRSFGAGEHLATVLGPRFIREMYRWFVTSPQGFGSCCYNGGELVAFATLCDGPYHRLMFTQNRRATLMAFLMRPWLAFHPGIWKRVLGLLRGPDEVERIMREHKDAVQCGLIAVHPDHRKTGLSMAMQRFLFEECRKRGWRKLVGTVYKSNAASRRMVASVGYEELPLKADSDDRVVILKRL